jgi:2,4-dienoyl-CoA reductase-like NADH-dependent reductase (Old Yellow Enzyme family)
MIKMNCDDFVPGGLTMDESVRLARLIESAGIDCIEITAGIWETHDRISKKGINKVEKEAYFYPYAEALRKAVSIPLILVGGMRSPNVIEKVLSDGVADMVSLCRPFIREPQLIRRWKEGDLSKARCISCNKCTENTFRRTLRCYVEELEKEKRAKTKNKE